MALTLLEMTPSRESDARAFLESVSNGTPRIDFLVEDLAIQAQAASRIDELNRESQ